MISELETLLLRVSMHRREESLCAVLFEQPGSRLKGQDFDALLITGLTLFEICRHRSRRQAFTHRGFTSLRH